MTIWYAQNSTVNIDSANEWNDAANGSGNWLTWGNLAAGDILCANGKTAIALNVASFTCTRISTAAEGTGSAGGGFTCNLAAGANRSYTCDVTAGTTACITNSGTTYTFAVTGNVTGGSAAAAYGIKFINSITITGSVTGGTNGTAYGLYSDTYAQGATISGAVTAGSAGSALRGNQATWTIGGALTAANNSPAISVYANNVTVILSGNLVCSSNCTFPVLGGTSGFIFKWNTADGGTATMYDASAVAHVLKVPQYPAANDVQLGSGTYDYGAQTPNFTVPTVGQVQSGVGYGAGGTEFTGTLSAGAAAHLIGA